MPHGCSQAWTTLGRFVSAGRTILPALKAMGDIVNATAETVKVTADASSLMGTMVSYTVKSNGEQLFITRIDSLDESGAQQVWDMLEERNRWREVEEKATEMGGYDNLSEDVIDSLYEHALD